MRTRRRVDEMLRTALGFYIIHTTQWTMLSYSLPVWIASKEMRCYARSYTDLIIVILDLRCTAPPAPSRSPSSDGGLVDERAYRITVPIDALMRSSAPPARPAPRSPRRSPPPPAAVALPPRAICPRRCNTAEGLSCHRGSCRLGRAAGTTTVRLLVALNLFIFIHWALIIIMNEFNGLKVHLW